MDQAFMYYKGVKDKLIGAMVIILFSPFIIALLLFALPILVGDYVYSRYRNEPRPKVPKTVRIDGISGEEIAAKCLKFIASHLSDVKYKVESSENCYRLESDSSSSRVVTLSHDTAFGIEIADLNTYEWYIDENHRDIDLYLWITIGVLRGGVQRVRSRLGRASYWVWCSELGVWVVLQKEGTSYDGIHFYNNPPEHIKVQFSAL